MSIRGSVRGKSISRDFPVRIIGPVPDGACRRRGVLFRNIGRVIRIFGGARRNSQHVSSFRRLKLFYIALMESAVFSMEPGERGLTRRGAHGKHGAPAPLPGPRPAPPAPPTRSARSLAWDVFYPRSGAGRYYADSRPSRFD